MNKLACFALLLGACATAPRSGIVDRTVLEHVTVVEAREAARAVLEEIADPPSVVRITDEGSVLTDGRFGRCDEDVACGSLPRFGGGTGSPLGAGRTTIEVRLQDLGTSTEVEIDIEYETRCPGSSAATCQPEPLASNGGLERRILDGIRAWLGAARG